MSGTHWKKLTNPNYLGSWDFSQGEERTLTIDKVLQDEVVDMENIKKDMNARKLCVVAHFKENCKPMILNKTNCKMLQNLFNTPIIEEWAGRSIIIKVEKVKAFGKLEEALRIKNQIPSAVKRSESIPLCADCGEDIKDIEGYTAAQIAEINMKRYGIALCAECSGKRKLNME